jgi:hypothetical protein
VLESKLVWARVPYLMHGVAPRCRTLETITRQTQEPVAVRCVDPDEAEISISVRWPGGHRPRSLHWRFFDNAFWRPILSPQGQPILQPDAFEQLVAEEDPNWDDWQDYPFRGKFHCYRQSESPFGLPEDPPPAWRVRGDERGEAVVRAQVIAAHELIYVGDVLYRRALPPMWAFGSLSRFEQSQTMALIMPELASGRTYRAGYLCMFSLNRQEEALAFANQMAQRRPFDDILRQTQVWPRKAQTVEVTCRDAAHIPDDQAFSFVWTYEQLHRTFQRIRYADIPRSFLATHVKLGETAEQLTRCTSPTDRQLLVRAAIEAVDAISASMFPLSQTSRDLLGEAVRIARMQQWRNAFENDQADAEAFAEM